jgi:hypothetical protein
MAYIRPWRSSYRPISGSERGYFRGNYGIKHVKYVYPNLYGASALLLFSIK